jgi:hypothetical protein
VASFEFLRYFTGSTANVVELWTLKPRRLGLAEYLTDVTVPGSSGNYLFTKESWKRAGGYPEFAGALDTWGFGLRQVATGSTMAVQPGSHYFHRKGHDSYWVRQSRSSNVNLIALQVLLPYLHLLRDADADYVMSRRGRLNWLADLPGRPLRVKPGGKPSDVPFAPPTLRKRVRRLGGRVLRGLGLRK